RLPDVARDVRDKFGRSLSTAPPAPNLPKAPTATGSSTRRLPMPGRSQVEIRIGTRSVARSDPQYAAAFLANEVLGGRGLLSRLFQNVREREGLAYHASSSLESMRWGGFFVAQVGTNPKQAKRALRLLRHEVERLSTELVPSGELHRIRESAIGALPLSVETTAGAHELALDVAYHDLAPDHYRRWPAELRRLSRRELRDASAQAFDISRAITVLAGPL
ncbi:MAG TPA: insulinase family protein, partial [Thermoplasmata archaeon]|nr:insulinase family protein [Thermoplasmata archaeon]